MGAQSIDAFGPPRVAARGESPALAACSNGSSNSSSGGLGSGSSSGNASSNQTYKIGFQGALSGDNQQLGINEVNAAELAVSRPTTRATSASSSSCVKSDDGGTADKAPAAAAASSSRTPPSSASSARSSPAPTKAVGTTYAQAGMALISPSATNPTLTSSGFTDLPPDRPDRLRRGHRRPPTGWPRRPRRSSSINDITDVRQGCRRRRSRQELKTKGVTVARTRASTPRPRRTTARSRRRSSPRVPTRCSTAATTPRRALLAKALQAAGLQGHRGWPATACKSSVFTQNAGAAGNGWYFTCGCQDATVGPAGEGLHRGLQRSSTPPPSTYSPEAYDATNALIQAIKDGQGQRHGHPPDRRGRGAASSNYKGITTDDQVPVER